MREMTLKRAIREVNPRKTDPNNWPRCYICLKGVDSVQKEDQGKRYIVLRAKCHGAEDVIRVNFEWDMGETDERIPMRGLAFFPVDLETRIDEKKIIHQVKDSIGETKTGDT